jgi:hypothetical protein
MLLERYRIQIEQNLERPLTEEDLAVAATVGDLSDAQVELGRALAELAQVLSLQYMRAVVPDLNFRNAADAVDHVFLRRLPPQSWIARF